MKSKALFFTRYRTLIFYIITAAALFIYIFSADYNSLGQYNDDAWYINAARYLAGVQSIQKDLQGRPLGYPLLLAPVARMFPESISVFRITSIIFMIMIPILVYYLLGDMFKPNEILVFIALLCHNHFSVILSGDVLSDVPYLLFTFAAIILLKYYLCDENNMLKLFLMCIVLAILFYIRPQGILLYISLLSYFIISKRYRTVLYMTFFVLLAIIPAVLPGAVAGSSIDKYIAELGMTYGSSSFFHSMFGNALYYLKWGIYIGLLGIVHFDWNAFMYPDFVIIPVSIFVLVLIIAGFLKKEDKEFMKPIKIYLLLYIMLHFMWVNVSLRYMFPVFPLLLYYMIKGSIRLNRKLYCIITIIMIISYSYSNSVIVGQSRGLIERKTRKHIQTYKWIDGNVPENAVLCSNFAERLFLKTSRKSIILDFNSRDDFYHKILSNEVTYVVMYTSRFIQKSQKYSIAKVRHLKMRYFLNDETRFKKVYVNPDEETVIWKINSRKDFKKAWIHYRQGMILFNKQKIDMAIAEMYKALEVYKDMPIVSGNLAALHIIKKEYGKALEILDASIIRYQGDPGIYALRGKVNSFLGKDKEAGENWKKALKISEYLQDTKLKNEIYSEIDLTKNQ